MPDSEKLVKSVEVPVVLASANLRLYVTGINNVTPLCSVADKVTPRIAGLAISSYVPDLCILDV